MRERLAMIVLAVALAVLVALAAAFAWRHNQEPPASPSPTMAPTMTTTDDRGPRLFREHGCTLCHALGGNGNPRYPLDGVGGKFNEVELRHGILGTGPFTERLTGPVLRRKERYRELPEDDLAALIAYLSSQR